MHISYGVDSLSLSIPLPSRVSRSSSVPSCPTQSSAFPFLCTFQFTSSVLTPTVLASMVESVWCPGTVSHRMKLADVLWINSGQHGMRVWLPLFPQSDKVHNFMSKRIMLPFQCSIYPLGRCR